MGVLEGVVTLCELGVARRRRARLPRPWSTVGRACTPSPRALEGEANDMLYGGAAGGAAATAMTLVDIERELTTHEPPMPTGFKRCAPPDG